MAKTPIKTSREELILFGAARAAAEKADLGDANDGGPSNVLAHLLSAGAA